MTTIYSESAAAELVESAAEAREKLEGTLKLLFGCNEPNLLDRLVESANQQWSEPLSEDEPSVGKSSK